MFDGWYDIKRKYHWLIWEIYWSLYRIGLPYKAQQVGVTHKLWLEVGDASGD